MALPAILQPSQAHPAHAGPAPSVSRAAPTLVSVATQAETAVAPARTVEGPRQALGRGEAFSWVGLDAAGRPISLGIGVTQTALDELPDAATELNLALPAEAGTLGYDHVGLDWIPHGHEPAGVYDKPHFDLHFYRISVAARDRITPEDPDYEAKLAREPAAGLVPPGFARVPSGVPRMGAHWVAADAPELAGQPFERTLLLGSYDGELTFVEPMITRAFLQARTEAILPVRAPQGAVGALAWPAAYRVSFDQGIHHVALVGLRPLPQR
ncbi:hypothetical protein DFH01_24985 [Falsiroseomonas bella]|uniref:TTHB210-like domain-containing protein n=2 Tax=Falsiroseomonas bella TaxID=2184016 RepID=A0A317F9N5_9PROT|nr:hypothetical protein DFH01_24985 [Falsiroseomonas bella]